MFLCNICIRYSVVVEMFLANFARQESAKKAGLRWNGWA